MKTLKLYIILLLFGSLCLTYCKKRNLDLETECSLPTAFSTVFIESGKQYKLPSFNPMDNEEFVFAFIDYDNGIEQLKKFNLATHEIETVVSGFRISTEAKWNKNDWVAFSSESDKKLRAVKLNGDSMHVVYDSPFAIFIDWLPNNEIIWTHTYTLGLPYYLLKQRVGEDHADTLHFGPIGRIEIISDSIIIAEYYASSQTTIGTSSTDEIDFMLSTLPDFHILDFAVSPTSPLLYLATNKHGLLSYNTENASIQILVPHCDRLKYHSVSCSPDGKKLIGEKVHTDPEYENGQFTGTHQMKSKIYLFHLGSGIEQHISID